MINRKDCPLCGEPTEFVQFATGEEETTSTTPKEVGDGVLELRTCDRCPAEVENVLNVFSCRASVVEEYR